MARLRRGAIDGYCLSRSHWRAAGACPWRRRQNGTHRVHQGMQCPSCSTAYRSSPLGRLRPLRLRRLLRCAVPSISRPQVLQATRHTACRANGSEAEPLFRPSIEPRLACLEVHFPWSEGSSENFSTEHRHCPKRLPSWSFALDCGDSQLAQGEEPSVHVLTVGHVAWR